MTQQPSIFDSNRFLAYCRLYIGRNSRELILLGITLPIVFIITDTICIPLCTSMTPGVKPADFMWSTCIGLGTLLFVLFATIAGNKMYSSMSSPKDRLTEIEIPASEFEKFLTWFLIYVACVMPVLFISFYVGDFVRVFILRCFVHGSAACRPVAPSMLRDMGTVTYAFIFLAQSLFALGSITFHKHAYLKTVCTLFVLNCICGIASALSISIFFGRFNLEPRFFSDSDNNDSSYLIAAIITAIAIFLQWLAYRRYKEDDTVSRW